MSPEPKNEKKDVLEYFEEKQSDNHADEKNGAFLTVSTNPSKSLYTTVDEYKSINNEANTGECEYQNDICIDGNLKERKSEERKSGKDEEFEISNFDNDNSSQDNCNAEEKFPNISSFGNRDTDSNYESLVFSEEVFDDDEVGENEYKASNVESETEGSAILTGGEFVSEEHSEYVVSVTDSKSKTIEVNESFADVSESLSEVEYENDFERN